MQLSGMDEDEYDFWSVSSHVSITLIVLEWTVDRQVCCFGLILFLEM